MCYGHLNATTQKSPVEVIRRFTTLLATKLQKDNNKRLHRIRAEKRSALETIYIKGSFTEPAWEVVVPLAYSIAFKEYFIELWLPEQTEFVLVRKGQEILDESFPTQISGGRLVNFTCLPTPSEIYLGMKEPPPTPSLSLKSYGVSCGKTPNSNEDAFFTATKVIGVSDGVGGLQHKFGISSKDFSTQLMQGCSGYSAGQSDVCCKRMIKHAYSQLVDGGSATYSVASLRGSKLQVLNMGDSGLALFRLKSDKWMCVFQTTPMQTSFNTPHQISKRFSPSQLKRVRSDIKRSAHLLAYCREPPTDIVRNSEESHICVKPGDLIVLGTDGVWDNLYAQEIADVIACNQETSEEAHIAKALVQRATERAEGTEATPFSQAIENTLGVIHRGGKRDDVTVVVARVV